VSRGRQPHRVIQWSTGNVGAHAVRAIAERPSLKLVGAYVTNADKDGRDVGDIVGVAPLGVKATTDADRLVALDADVVLHCPLPSLVHGDDPDLDLDVICRLLASGKNVITVVGYMYPKVYGPRVMRRLADACRRGGTTFHGTGLNPGWMGELLPLTMSALCRRIDKVHVTEITDFVGYPSPEIMMSMMGFGSSPAAFARRGRRRREWLDALFRESIQLLADGLGVHLDRITHQVEVDVAPGDLDVAAGRIERGTVAGQHWVWTGRVGRRDVLVHETVWRMGPDAGTAWPTGDHRIQIDGQPRMRIDLRPSWLSDGLQATAMHAVNAVPAVVAASPGIRTFLDLPLLTGRDTVGPADR
jgi:hypothetical protein